MAEELVPCAKWTEDCNGKQDYDGRLLSISTRYWPAWKSADNRPSAVASIVLNHGEPDQYGYNDYIDLVVQGFAAPTEQEVKVQVEAWAKQKVNRIAQILKEANL